MLEYIKAFVVSIISGIFAPLISSSSAHYSFLNSILNFETDKEKNAFYFSVVSLVFSLVAIFFVRKIYAKGFKALFGKKIKNYVGYKEMMKGILISFIPALIMFFPVSKGTLLMDIFDGYLSSENTLVTAFCCFASGFILIIALWYSRQQGVKTHRSSTHTDVLRMSIYQLPTFILPGFSHVSNAATSLILSGLNERVIMREVFIYLAPPVLVFNAGKIIRYILSGLTVDPLTIAVCAVAALAGNIITFNLVSKVNIRKSFLFFSIYSIVMGIFMGLTSFYIK